MLLIAVWETKLLKLALPKCHLVISSLKGVINHGVLKPGFRTAFLEALLHGVSLIVYTVPGPRTYAQ